MNKEKLKEKILGLEDKYSNNKKAITNYYQELLNVFYEYSDTNYNTDYEFDEVFKDIVSGEDCICLVMGARENELYYWKEVDGKTVVDKIDYEYLTDLSKKAVKCYDKEKQEDFDIC